MASKIVAREEFDARLMQSTEQVRQKHLTLEAQATELEDLIGRYPSVLERLEAKAEQEMDTSSAQRDDLRNLLTALAERTSSVAASL